MRELVASLAWAHAGEKISLKSSSAVGAVAHRPNAEKMVSNNSSTLAILEPRGSSVKPSSLVQALFLHPFQEGIDLAG
jgi:hypothetical protein